VISSWSSVSSYFTSGRLPSSLLLSLLFSRIRLAARFKKGKIGFYLKEKKTEVKNILHDSELVVTFAIAIIVANKINHLL
jgi:hypothetical protein